VSRPEIVGLFPSFSHKLGGVEESSRQAVSALGGKWGSNFEVLELAEAPEAAKFAWKATEIGRAIAQKSPSRMLLVWHLGLLRLSPALVNARPKVVVFLHGIEAWKKITGLTNRALARTDHFLTNSDFTWTKFVEFNPSFAGTGHTTVPLGLGEPMKHHPSPIERPQAVMISRLAREENYKGHHEMIGVWPDVVKRVPEAKLIVIGEGNLRVQLETLVRSLDITDSVTFLGRVSEERKNRVIADSRFLALPSRGEGFGLVYLEALRAGRRCLVGHEDAGPEVVAPPVGGICVNPTNQAELFTGICDLLEKRDDWEERSLAARKRYEDNFTEAHFRERLVQAIDRLL
jgi:phosphatidyl-myo-inositol dimannoside synthase